MSQVSHLLNRTVLVFRHADTSDGAGGRTSVLDQVGDAGFPCRLSQPGAVEAEYGASASAEISQVVYFDPDTDIRRGDVLQDESTQMVYRIVSVIEPSVAIYRKALCEGYQVELSS